MALLGIVADTHVPQRLARLPDRLADALQGVDLILHAGDITSRQVLIDLGRIAPVQAVAGNADLVGHGLPLTRVIEIEGRRIGLVHGHGGLVKYLTGKVHDRLGYREEYYLKIVAESFGQVDAIVFGHTHRVFTEIRSGVLLFNPGPVAPDYYNTPGPQIGLLRITPMAIEPTIVGL
ncbi:MAG: YfcE family phosphodiesterase [Thermoflexales bacterium]|nr:YfcE family phosphodiesterase [Thermoflexales bacterium]